MDTEIRGILDIVPNNKKIDKNILQLQRPTRYLGGEVNSVRKDLSTVSLRVALCFPDTYEIGMSHLGLKILYSILNDKQQIYAERAYAPWIDMEHRLRAQGAMLSTLETDTPLCHFDLVGFSLQYELCITSVLQMLDLGGIALFSDVRIETDPIVIAGGPVTYNPLPFSKFFDVFVIGDGEEVVLEIANVILTEKEKGRSRKSILASLSEVPGIYVPSIHGIPSRKIIQKRLISDLNAVPYPLKQPVPFCETVHDRIGLEIARGCTRGCRFCQAGMLCRPVRERSPEQLMSFAQEALQNTGWEEIALLSLSTGDYSCLSPLVKSLINKFDADRIALSLPSMRTDTFDEQIINYIRKIRQTGLTLAPEAGTDRLRSIINKGNSEEDLEKAIKAAFVEGQKKVKLYFMIGLPFEKNEDLDGIIGLLFKSAKWAKGGSITGSISNFVPKAHTPFQWAAQIDLDEINRKRNYIAQYFQRGKIRVKFHNAKMSILEGIIARGDERISNIIFSAYSQGARFDGWDEQLQFDIWLKALTEHGFDYRDFLRERSTEDQLPWYFIDSRIDPSFLKNEWERARNGETTQDCRYEGCVGCGICDFSKTKPVLVDAIDLHEEGIHDTIETNIRRFRLQYAKLGNMSLMGHHEIVRAFQRAFRRADVTLDHTKGFHPHPKLRFSLPLGVGIQSVAELLEFDTQGYAGNTTELLQELIVQLPDGLKPTQLEEISLKHSSILGKIKGVTYKIDLGELWTDLQIADHLKRFHDAEEFPIIRNKKGKSVIRDLKRSITGLQCSEDGFEFTLSTDHDSSVHPLDAVSALLGMEREQTLHLQITKTAVLIAGMEGPPYGQ